MKKYLAYTRKLAEATPASRNRIVDFWRVVAILVVMFGHWLAASIWLRPDDEIELLNSLESDLIEIDQRSVLAVRNGVLVRRRIDID